MQQPPTESPFNSFDGKLLVHSSDAERVDFYKRTYGHVVGGVLVFIIFEYLLLQSDTVVNFAMSMTQGYRWLIMLGGFMFITSYAERMTIK